jgi:glutaredoxin
VNDAFGRRVDRSEAAAVAHGQISLPSARQRPDMSITLYALDGCPFCEKVHDALEEEHVDYETVWVDALHSDRNEVKRVSGQRSVPVLVDDERGVTMNESDNILQYVDETLASA